MPYLKGRKQTLKKIKPKVKNRMKIEKGAEGEGKDKNI